MMLAVCVLSPGDICPGGGGQALSIEGALRMLGSCLYILGSIQSGRVRVEPVVIIGQPVSNNA